MVRLGKLTDYGLVLMSCIARSEGLALHSASDLARESGLPVSTVRKLLKELLKSGLLMSHRGTRGGYFLAREPRGISVIDMIAALEGPFALTECSSDTAGLCKLETNCPISKNQRIINQAVREALGTITLANLIQPMELVAVKDARGKVLPAIGIVLGRVQ
jgi:FeS assembly SUF system regulator